MALSKLERRQRIKHRIRKIISGTAEKPRLSVFRSNKEIYAQLVDDVNGVTIAAASSRDKDIKASNKQEAATAVGKAIASQNLTKEKVSSLLENKSEEKQVNLHNL